MKIPIIGADLLAHYEQAAHVNPRTLSDVTTNFHVRGTPTHHSTTGISVAMHHDRDYMDTLNLFVDITHSFKATDSSGHQTQHHIRTSGPPTYSCPRRFGPHKLAYAKEQFNQMLNAGIVCPSDSPYDLLLHLAPKPGGKEYRMC